MENIDTADALAYIRKESLDIFNRLHSIEEDIQFVDRVREEYPEIPLLPNLRCGSWYTNPKLVADVPAYFKSTDGHNNNWSFNLRRSNLHLLPLVVQKQGIILVDSTRSGKRIPDALAKTVPIWCAVINRAFLIRHPNLDCQRENSSWDTVLYTPPSIVSMLEHSQISQRLDGWAQALADSSFSLPGLPFPLRPIWITPATTTFPILPSPESQDACFLPVICVSASKQIDQGLERRSYGFSYVQGSGDDHELWGMGLTPQLFWRHHDELLNAKRDELSSLVSRIVLAQTTTLFHEEESLIQPTPIVKIYGRLLICKIADIPRRKLPFKGQPDYLILTSSIEQGGDSTDSRLYLPVLPGKRGQADFLNTILPRSMDFIHKKLAQGISVCLACESGKDLAVGVALAALQLFFADNGEISLKSGWGDELMTGKIEAIHRDKSTIRTRLEWIIASRPEANPSRTTLKRVNEFLLTSPLYRTITVIA